ncbi:hypothetical protein AGR4A_Cc180028 [Agrobacterium tumefaciens str. B6]|uniref:Uncharacterized protein n=1 Tax=Agrobacterium tumefaciens str. B6 TaxID=1183423 RepID=A0A822UXW9_AGRTU|nr:hypothetical protein AGR4A_Cc180028 [Agrobacterium tumefaciens str. B6]
MQPQETQQRGPEERRDRLHPRVRSVTGGEGARGAGFQGAPRSCHALLAAARDRHAMTEDVNMTPSYARIRLIGLIFLSQHDGKYPLGDSGVFRGFRTVLQGRVVIVDFPEYLMPLNGHGAEIMFSVGIVVRREGIEALHGLGNTGLRAIWQVLNAGGQKHLACEPSGAEDVIQFTDTAGLRGCHGFVPCLD